MPAAAIYDAEAAQRQADADASAPGNDGCESCGWIDHLVCGDWTRMEIVS
jgi:hypothetical protein